MQGHWIGGTRKLNRHWQSGTPAGIISRVYEIDFKPRILYPQLNLSGGLSSVNSYTIIGNTTGVISNLNYIFRTHFFNSPRVDFYIYNDDTIPFYVLPEIPANNNPVGEWMSFRPVRVYMENSTYYSSGIQNVTTPISAAYTTVCMDRYGAYSTLGLRGHKVDPLNELHIISFLPFFADNVNFIEEVLHVIGLDITEDQRFGDGTALNTFKRATPLNLKIRVELYRDGSVL